MTNNDASSYASILVVSTHTSITVGSNHIDSLNSIRRLATLAVSDPRLATLAPLLGVWGGARNHSWIGLFFLFLFIIYFFLGGGLS